MLTAAELARRLEAHHSCVWRDERRAPGVECWLETFWTSACPPEPDTCPDAVSHREGNGGAAIRWYERDCDGDLLGYVAGITGRCYHLPTETPIPSLVCALEEDGPVCDGDDHDLRPLPDVLLPAIPIVRIGDESAAHQRLPSDLPEPPLTPLDPSGGDWLPASDLFHRQPEGDRQFVG